MITRSIPDKSSPPIGIVTIENQNKEKAALLDSFILSPKSPHNHCQEKGIIIGDNVAKSTRIITLKLFK